MKVALTYLAVLAILLLFACASLVFPGRATLEVYDVQDIVYMLDGPSPDEITLAMRSTSTVVNPVEYWTLSDLAEETRCLVPGAGKCAGDRSVQAQNGLLIVRATATQHLAVRARLSLARAWISFVGG